MKIEDAIEGMRVIIDISIATTHKKFGSCRQMTSMTAKQFNIDGIDINGGRIFIEGYTWDASDITPVKIIELKPFVFHFDPTFLNI